MHIETRQVIYLDLFVAALLAMIEFESLRKKAIKQDETEELKNISLKKISILCFFFVKKTNYFQKKKK